ncbi:type VI secretion system tube protein TssD [Dysgonomonas sp. ZJ709]|uniref:type VI secretion system tube protein TssD n=1 Tax=Dysgonomonas sp. ZJ709 TaxID=2709797 RepID=UPI0013EC64F5|nr:type VI secretion system tube protein TssD [Dysgonomonas sp. ZJ709]
MFTHKSYLKLGDVLGTDLLSLLDGGYELANCEFSFQQGIDDTGKASTQVFGGTLSLTLPMLPPKPIIEWALNSCKYMKGAIVLLNDHDEPVEKIWFENAACISLDVDYTQRGESYMTTKIEVQAESLLLDNGLDFDNEWVK